MSLRCSTWCFGAKSEQPEATEPPTEGEPLRSVEGKRT